MNPREDSLRRVPTHVIHFGQRVEIAVRSTLKLTSSESPVEIVRRTARGGYCVQFSESIAPRVRRLASLSINSGEQWTIHPLSAEASVSPRDKNSRNVRRDCFVISRIPSELSEVDILPRLARQNASRLRTTERDLLSRFRSVKTLQRRLASGKDARKWVPSSSVCVYADPKLVSSVLTLGLVILDYQTYSVRPFEMPVLQCEREEKKRK